MNKYKINNLGVFKHYNKYFIGFIIKEDENIIEDLDGQRYNYSNSNIELVRPLSYYYPEPAYKKQFGYNEINGKKVPVLPAKLMAENNAFITKDQAKAFEKGSLIKILKKERKLIDSDKLLPPSHFFTPIQEREIEN